MLIAQFSDLHLHEPKQLAFGRVDTAAALERAVAAALPHRPDLLLLTGDIADAGRPRQYARVRELLAPLQQAGTRVLPVPGNHDDRETLRAAFADVLADPAVLHGGSDLTRRKFLQWCVDLPTGVRREPGGMAGGCLRVIGLDTSLSKRSHGFLCAERIDWLEARLDEAQRRPTLIAMHHPPFATGLVAMDGIGLRHGVARLEALLKRHPQVERVVCGHVHRTVTARFGGTLAVTCPSTAYAIDSSPAAMRHPRSAEAEPGLAWNDEPPGWLLHRWTDATGLSTQVMACGPAAEARPFA